jgi:hypothetical protein
VTALGFGGIALRTLGEYWPVFAAGALVQGWIVVRRMRRLRPFPPEWALTSAIAAALMGAALWVEPFLATQLAYQTVGEGARATPWSDLQAHVLRSWPLGGGLVLVVLALVSHPRSNAAVAALVAAAGVLVSWMAAMWLFATNHSETAFRVLVLPGGLGAVASLAGFTTATAVWVAIGRWIWRQGRRPPDAPRPRLEVGVAPARALPEGAPREDDREVP